MERIGQNLIPLCRNGFGDFCPISVAPAWMIAQSSIGGVIMALGNLGIAMGAGVDEWNRQRQNAVVEHQL